MKFQKNEGKFDRMIRLVAGALLIAGGLLYLQDIALYISVIVGLILVLTGLTGFCGLYTVLGINTLAPKAGKKD